MGPAATYDHIGASHDESAGFHAIGDADLVPVQPALSPFDAPEEGAARVEPVRCLERPSRFTALLRRTKAGRDLGLRLEPLGGAFLVSVVVEGPGTCVGRYNDEAPLDRRIRAGDHVVAVDGERDPLAMRQQMENDEFEFFVERPAILKLIIFKLGGPLGMGVKYTLASQNLIVKSLDEDGAARHAGVELSDRITVVNGLQGHASQLLEEIRRGDTLELTVERSGDG